MKLIPALLPICALLLPCALPAETFEGKITMSVTSSAKEGTNTMTFSIKNGETRMDIDGGKGQMTVIMDPKNQQMLMLMPQQQMYMVRPIPAPPTPAPGAAAPTPAHAPVNVQDTGIKETILGYSCTKYIYTTERGTISIWATDQLGTFNGLYGGGGRRSPPPEWEAAFKGRGFFPMRVESDAASKDRYKLEVTAVQRGSLPDSLFQPPEGWRKFDLGGILGGALQGGNPGARPGGNN
jgi:hypothetical protein